MTAYYHTTQPLTESSPKIWHILLTACLMFISTYLSTCPTLSYGAFLNSHKPSRLSIQTRIFKKKKREFEPNLQHGASKYWAVAVDLLQPKALNWDPKHYDHHKFYRTYFATWGVSKSLCFNQITLHIWDCFISALNGSTILHFLTWGLTLPMHHFHFLTVNGTIQGL